MFSNDAKNARCCPLTKVKHCVHEIFSKCHEWAPDQQAKMVSQINSFSRTNTAGSQHRNCKKTPRWQSAEADSMLYTAQTYSMLYNTAQTYSMLQYITQRRLTPCCLHWNHLKCNRQMKDMAVLYKIYREICWKLSWQEHLKKVSKVTHRR